MTPGQILRLSFPVTISIHDQLSQLLATPRTLGYHTF